MSDDTTYTTKIEHANIDVEDEPIEGAEQYEYTPNDDAPTWPYWVTDLDGPTLAELFDTFGSADIVVSHTPTYPTSDDHEAAHGEALDLEIMIHGTEDDQ